MGFVNREGERERTAETKKTKLTEEVKEIIAKEQNKT